ncbi:unnamed protein product [Durusdinium trenchii]|uniref:Aminoglycoside phosphotransferase domain-containing protein n=2 Tax=Durusdinium trenchii TaxID=1381693 RepID=A0ABP0N3X4_9DINO
MSLPRRPSLPFRSGNCHACGGTPSFRWTVGPEEKQKWERNLQSYANELAFFLNRDLQKALEKHSVLVPKLYGHESVPGRRYVLLTENLKPSWTTWAVHPATRSPEVFRWLAGFHGAFQGLLPEHTLWDFGTHVHLDRRPSKELENLPQSIADFCRDFAGLDPFFGRPESRLLGQRLQSVARKVSEHLSPGPENRPRVTLVHGDFKGANYFLKNEGEGCCAFDWQWTGPGLGATDLIYLFCGSVEDEIVQDYQRWLKLYHDHLIQTAGAVEQYNYSFDAFLLDFKAATLDYARWVFAYRLMGDTPEKFRARAENVDVNLGLFRRHPPRIRWLLQLVEEFLSDFEE